MLEYFSEIDFIKFIPIILLLLLILVIYLILMARAIIQMLRHQVSNVLLVFAFLSLIPFPIILILGIMVLIIWHYHKKDILAGRIRTR